VHPPPARMMAVVAAVTARRASMHRGFAAAAGPLLLNVNQSLLVSGESGAGKTEATKIVLRYITHVAGAPTGHGGAGGLFHHATVAQQVLESNPILEVGGSVGCMCAPQASPPAAPHPRPRTLTPPRCGMPCRGRPFCDPPLCSVCRAVVLLRVS
jgi:hypothetical protein